MKAVILAAGIGERLRPFTYTKPKALIEFDGVTITEMCLRAFSEFGVTDVAIVIGHFGNLIQQRIGDSYEGMKIHYLYNPFYPITGGAHSLWLARQFFEGKPCIIMDGDHLIDKRLLQKLIKAPYENCMLVDDWQQIKELSEETVIVGKDGVIKYLAWSSTGELHKMLNPKDCIGEAIIIVKLGAEASGILSNEVDRYLRKGGSGILEIIDPFNNTFRRCEAQYLSTDGLPWIEIDFPEDLDKAKNEIYPKIKGIKK